MTSSRKFLEADLKKKKNIKNHFFLDLDISKIDHILVNRMLKIMIFLKMIFFIGSEI